MRDDIILFIFEEIEKTEPSRQLHIQDIPHQATIYIKGNIYTAHSTNYKEYSDR
jgi:hypothetical protein